MGERTDQDKEPPWLTTLKASTPVFILGVIVVIFAGIKDISEGWEQLLIRVGLKPDALVLAQDSAKTQFAVNLMKIASKRAFWARRYVTSITFKFSQSDQQDIWKSYLSSVEEWNINLLVNVVGLESYYNSSKRESFEGVIAPHVTAIHDCLLRLHFPEVYASRPDKNCAPTGLGPPVAANPEAINKHLDLLENQLYCFTTGLSKTRLRCPLVIAEESGTVDLGPAPEPAKPETPSPQTEKPN